MSNFVFLSVSFFFVQCSHGTKCAGIIAGSNNTDCGIGIAFDAQIASKKHKSLLVDSHCTFHVHSKYI